MESTNTTFKVCISSQPISKNNLTEYLKNLSFFTTTLTIDQLSLMMGGGYCYCGVMDIDNWKYQGTSRKERFQYTSLITLDIDNLKAELTLTEILEGMAIKPSLIYTTTNHQRTKSTEKAYGRVRAIYLMESPISDKETYNQIQSQIMESYNPNIFDSTKGTDKTTFDITKWFAGNNTSNFQSVTTKIVYSLKDFNIIPQAATRPQPQKREESKEEKINFRMDIDQSILEDFKRLTYNDFLLKHLLKFQIIQRQDKPFNDEGYCLMDFDRLRHNPLLRLKDGQQRRRSLWNWAIYRKALKPNISAEEQLYNIVNDIVTYIDNSDGALTKKEVINNLLKSSMKYNPTIKSERKYILIDDDYCRKNGLNKRSYLHTIKDRIKHDICKPFINKSQSLRKNLLNINSQNLAMPTGEEINISINTLRKWIA